MESIQKNALLEWPPNAINNIRKIHNLDNKERIVEAITILEEWIQKQDHFLKKDFSRDYLERCLIASKGSVEKGKKQIDRLCTMKTILPHFFTMHNPKTDLKDIFDYVRIFPLPKLTKDFYRIYYIKHNGKPLTDGSMMEFYQYNLCVAEYLKAHDYANGFIVLYDLQNTGFGDLLTKINPITLQQYLTILMEGYGARLKATHMLTPSQAVDLLVKMIKQFLSKKISDRVFVHKTSEDVVKFIPKDLLPEDYGGKEKSVEELNKAWIEVLSSEKHVEYIKMMSQARTNEQMRRTDKFNDEYMGTPGSFRNLKVD